MSEFRAAALYTYKYININRVGSNPNPKYKFLNYSYPIKDQWQGGCLLKFGKKIVYCTGNLNKITNKYCYTVPFDGLQMQRMCYSIRYI